MAIIYSYPKNTNLLASDLLVGTSTAIVAGKKKNQTKSFSLGDLSNYVISNIPIGSISTLNQVLTAGNTSILNAKIGELYLWDGANEDYGKVNFIDGEFHVYDYTGDSIFWASRAGTITLFNLAGKVATLDSSTITENRMYSLPNKSGLVALVQDIPTSFGLYAQTADGGPVAATTVQTTIIGPGVGTLTVPANAFKIGDSFQASLDGIISCVGSATIHVRVKTSGGVILADTGIIDLEAATSKSWLLNLYFTIRTLGGVGVASISSGGLFSYVKNSGTNFEGFVLNTINTTTFNTTIANALDITVEWNTNNTGNSILSRNFTLTKVY